MFLSYKETKYRGFDSNTGLYHWEYKIVDNDFEHIGASKSTRGEAESIAISVIDTYEKRNLNVAANLVKMFIWQSKNWHWLSISDIVKLNKRYDPRFAKYEEDVNKYLILM